MNLLSLGNHGRLREWSDIGGLKQVEMAAIIPRGVTGAVRIVRDFLQD